MRLLYKHTNPLKVKFAKIIINWFGIVFNKLYFGPWLPIGNPTFQVCDLKA